MLSKLLLLVLVIVAAVTFWRTAQRSRTRQPRAQPPAVRPPEQMLRCPRCGVHFPASEAIVRDGQSYCCDAHSTGTQ